MRGGFLHNQVLIAPLAALLAEWGWKVSLEHRTGPGRGAGYVDLFAERDGDRTVIEAELSADRVARDLHKANALRVTLLVIVVPDQRTANAVERKLQGLPSGDGSTISEVWCLPLGLARQRLTQRCRLMTARNVSPNNKSEITGRTLDDAERYGWEE